jgi:hypothetical protein
MGEGNQDEFPSERNPRAFRIVQKAAKEHLKRASVWPRTIFEFEMRGAGVYPDFAGRSLYELHERGDIGEQKEIQGRNYFTRPGEEEFLSSVVENAVNNYYDLLDEIGKFGELVAYTSLSKIGEEYDHLIDIVEPEGDKTHRLRGIPRKPDAFLEYGNMCSPVEVYNGTEYVTEGHKKVAQQTIPAGSREEPHSRPLLIGPFASETAEEKVLNGDGVIAQTGKPLVCKSHLDEYGPSLEYLNLKSNFKFINKIKTKEGEEIDGEKYDNLLGSPDYRRITPDKIQADRVPTEYIKRVRGGVQLTYVSSLYQRAESKINEYACLVLQPMFHHLLRQDTCSIDDLIQFGWKDMGERYPRVKANVAKDRILEIAREYMQDLVEKMILEQSGDRYSTFKSAHPHISLSLDENLPL